MAIVEVSITPLGTASTSLSVYVAECHQVLAGETAIRYQLTPMGTILEGDLDEILRVVRRMHEIPFSRGALRVSTLVKIDDRRDTRASMAQKLSAVTEKLQAEEDSR